MAKQEKNKARAFEEAFRTKKLFLFSVFILVVLGLINDAFLRQNFSQKFIEEENNILREQLNSLRFQIESNLNNNLAFLNGLAAYISLNPDLDQEEFSRFASVIVDRKPVLVNLAAAPDLVVRFVYPIAGNEEVIGLDYRNNASQREEVLRVVNTNQMLIAGPVNLVQGGQALIGRAPVRYRNSDGELETWGIVSAPILLSTFFDQINLEDYTRNLDLAIRAFEFDQGSATTFFGNEDIFTNSRNILPINIGGSTWQLAARPADSLIQENSTLQLIRGICLAIIIILALLFYVMQIGNEKEKSFRELIANNERFLKEVENVSKVGGWRLDNNLVFTELSNQACLIADLPPGSVNIPLGRFCAAFSNESIVKFADYFKRGVSQREKIDTELEIKKLSGEIMWLQLIGDSINPRANKAEMVGAIQDITREKAASQLIEYQANYDSLTGLPNRTLFSDRLERAISRSSRSGNNLAVVFVDLDNFKTINDNLGHDAGDNVLKEAAKRIKNTVRDSDTVARYSGDEFTVMLDDIGSNTNAVEVVTKIIAQMDKAYFIADNQIYCSASVGISIFPGDGDRAETLITKADQAMYQVKNSGRHNWQFYTAEMQAMSEEKHRHYSELVEALKNEELMVFFQPIVDCESHEVISCEALVRWCKKNGDWIPPDKFITLAEERGIINRIDKFVLKNATEKLREINTRLGTNIHLSVNVSPSLLLLRDKFAEEWLDYLRSVKDLSISVEITERVLIDGTAGVEKLLFELNEQGINFSIDDFGTGYSGLSYFSRFPVSTMKIDRSFIDQMTQSTTVLSLVESMLLMAHKLDVKVVAEGVENSDQLEILKSNQCHYLQGYFFAPAMPPEDFVTFVKTFSH